MSRVLKGLEKVARDRRHLIAAQVRCSTGYTQGVAVDGMAQHAPLSARERRLAVRAAPDDGQALEKGKGGPAPRGRPNGDARLARWLKAPV